MIRTGSRLTIAAAILVCLAMLAPAARAAAPRAFYGVMAANDPTSSEVDRMGAGKVGTLRINLYWGAVQPQAGSTYDWSHYDPIIAAAARNGIRVLPTVYGSAPWAAGRPNYPPLGHLADFAEFVRAAAERYGSNGTFWQMRPTLPRVPVIWWQLWNEVNSPSFWYRKPNPKQYVRLLRAFHGGLKAGDPTARVVLAGLFPTPQVKHGIDSDRYLTAIYRYRAKPLFDATALHPYSTKPKDALRRLRALRRLMARFHDKRTHVWLTEIGWATSGPRTALTVSPKRQAAYLRKAYKLMAQNRKRMRIAGVVWYSWRDIPGGIWFQHTGLFTADLNPKPSWNAFVGLTGGSPNAPSSTSSTTGSPGSGLPLPLP